MRQFGIDPANMFGFWDWVGGRYSLWSAIGLPIALHVGMDHFEELLAGAHAMDEHFRTAPLEQNLPAMLGMLGIWYNNFFGAQTPRHPALRPVPRTASPPTSSRATWRATARASTAPASAVDYQTGPIIWGEPGTNGQHAFYQLIHQGTKLIPCDFLAAARRPHNPLGDHHDKLLANFFAQTEALMNGKTAAEARAELESQGLSGEALEQLLPHKIFPGNRPTTSILFQKLTPAPPGLADRALRAQDLRPGRRSGTSTASTSGASSWASSSPARSCPSSQGDAPVTSHDSSTNGLINYYKEMRG